MPFYNEDGDEVEGVLTPDEAKELQEKITSFQTDLEAKERELEGLKNKDLNFSKLHKKTDAEREELLAEFNEREKKLATEISYLGQRMEEMQEAQTSSYKQELINELVGDDDEFRKKLEAQVSEFNGEPKTREEIYDRYKKAYIILQGEQPKISPINKFVPSSTYTAPQKKDTKFTDTERGKKAYGTWFKDSKINQKKDG